MHVVTVKNYVQMCKVESVQNVWLLAVVEVELENNKQNDLVLSTPYFH